MYDGQVITRRRIDFLIRSDNNELLLETKAAAPFWTKMWSNVCSTYKMGVTGFACWSILAKSH